MVFRGGNNGGFRGKGHAGQGAGFRGKGAGGSRGGFSEGRNFSTGPPDRVIPLGYFDYACQMELICKVQLQDVPYFNAPIFLENKEQIGKIDEIFGNLRDYSVSIKLGDNMKASSFKPRQTFFIEPHKLLPLNRFLPKPPQPKGLKKKGAPAGVANNRGGTGRGGPGGRGGFIRRGGAGGGRGFGARGGGSNKRFGGRGGGRGRW